MRPRRKLTWSFHREFEAPSSWKDIEFFVFFMEYRKYLPRVFVKISLFRRSVFRHALGKDFPVFRSLPRRNLFILCMWKWMGVHLAMYTDVGRLLQCLVPHLFFYGSRPVSLPTKQSGSAMLTLSNHTRTMASNFECEHWNERDTYRAIIWRAS